ncbi:MAG TPA: HD domain-containing protein [Ktedonobacteraceae bacterium]
MESVISESQLLEKIYDEVNQRFADVDDLAHGWDHVNRVYHLALHIAEQEGADQIITGLAALMHDLGRTAPPDAGKHHADLSITYAEEIMQRYHLPIEKQEAVKHAIIAHSFSKGIEAQTLEARVVRDADRLDALGAIGIMRWAITGTQKHNGHTRPYHEDDPFAEQHELNDKLYMLDHFYVKLFKLGATMTTSTGRFLAQRRIGFMQTYLHEFKRELTNSDMHS